MADTISRPAERQWDAAELTPPADPLRQALAGGPVSVATMGDDLRYLWAFNWPGPLSAEELVGRGDEELYGAEAAPLSALKRRVLASGLPAAETVALTIDGVRRRFHLYVAPRPIAEGAGLICTCVDLSGEGDAEELLRARSAELDRREADHAAGVQREADHAAILAGLARALGQAGDDQLALARVITGELSGRLEVGCSLALLQEDGRTVAHVMADHPDPAARAALHASLGGASAPADSWPISRVLIEGALLSLSAEELLADRRSPQLPLWPLIEAGQLRELVSAPLSVRGRVVGALTLYGVGPSRARLADDIPFLQQLADTAALALDNASLLRAARRELAERQRAEESIRFQARLLDMVDQVIMVSDLEGRLIYLNQAAAQAYGWDPAEQIGRPAPLEAAELTGDAMAAIVDRIVAGESWSGEVRSRAADGRRLTQALLCSPVIEPDGRLSAIVSLAVDISERKRVEEELRNANARLAALNADLRRSRDLLRTIFDGLDDALALVGRDGRLLAINQRMAALAGRPADEMVGRPWADCCAGESMRQIGQMTAASQVDGVARRERVRVRLGDGLRIIDAQILPQLDEGRQIEQLVVRAHDVTDQAQLEAQMVEQERFAANGRLAATVAHEVNTPLQAIISCLHMAGRVGDAERGRYLKLAREEIHRIGYIMRQLLDLYRPEGGATSIDLNALAERVLLLTGSTLSRQRVRVDRALSADLPPTRGRTDEITQVLLNLVMNAAQAMPRGGVLRIETRPEQLADGLRAVIVVADSGSGVAAELHERIFEPFFTTREEGSGLGLAISRRIIVAHGGSIELESEPGGGSRFSVRLPAADD